MRELGSRQPSPPSTVSYTPSYTRAVPAPSVGDSLVQHDAERFGDRIEYEDDDLHERYHRGPDAQRMSRAHGLLQYRRCMEGGVGRTPLTNALRGGDGDFRKVVQVCTQVASIQGSTRTWCVLASAASRSLCMGGGQNTDFTGSATIVLPLSHESVPRFGTGHIF